MIKSVLTSLSIELLKIRRSSIFWITLGAGCFVSLIIGMMMVFVMNPSMLPPGILKTKVAIAAVTADWPSYTSFILMASSAIGIILFGFILSWIFGREYADRTAKDLLALPVSRTVIVVSKLLAAFLWCLLIDVIIYVLGIGIGLWIGLPQWSPELIARFTGIFVTASFLSLLLCPPVAYVASAGRGYLPAVGFVILCMGLANLFGNIGLGAYFPWTIPMLYSGAVGTAGSQLPLISWVILLLTGAAGTAAAILQWKYADQH